MINLLFHLIVSSLNEHSMISIFMRVKKQECLVPSISQGPKADVTVPTSNLYFQVGRWKSDLWSGHLPSELLKTSINQERLCQNDELYSDFINKPSVVLNACTEQSTLLGGLLSHDSKVPFCRMWTVGFQQVLQTPGCRKRHRQKPHLFY